MGKVWSVLFGAVLLAEFGLFLAAPFIPGWWLPANLAPFGGEVDGLFYLILAMTGFFFVLTEVILVYNLWQFGHDPARKSEYIHGNHRLEMFWTAIPAVLLVLIAVLQIRTWEKIKYQARMPDPDQVLTVTARQWEWRIRHAKDVLPVNPRNWADNPHIDDLHLVNELHTWKDANVKVYLKTMDVIHSFFLINLRVKQDALPGKTIPMWFAVNRPNMQYDPDTDTWRFMDYDEATKTWRKPKGSWLTYEFTCAELCGARHYAMRGRLCVHESKEDYLRWLEKASKLQKSSQPESKPGSLVDLVER